MPHKPSPVKPCALCGESVPPEADSRKPEAEPWIPESKLPSLPNTGNPRINSLIRKILLTTPEFPRFYADIILHYSPNSHEAKILRPHYQKICEKVNAMSNQNGTCTHIKVTGLRCGSPALRGEQFCYFHQNAIRSVRRPKQSRLHPIAMIEDEESIQYALMEVINALMRNTIDYKRATLILRALHIAVKNASRVKFGIQGKSSVTQVPSYADPTTEHEEIASESDLPAVAANPFLPIGPEGPRFWEQQAETARQIAREDVQRFAAEAKSREEARKRFAEERAEESRVRAELRAQTTEQAKPQASPSVGADPLVRPATTSEASGRVPSAEKTTNRATPSAVPREGFKRPQPIPTAQATTTAATPTRKPPQPAPREASALTTEPAPKQRKSAAHSLP